ncbi:MAG: adenylyl-sulfate kinase [Alphaproteobacteria bacterium]
MIIWLIGLSGSGKTTIGRALYKHFKPRHPNLVFVDGDEFRKTMGSDLSFTYEDRLKNAERFSPFCRFLDRQGIHMICAVLSIFPGWQKWNRENFSQYFEIFVDASLETVIERDPKGLYRQALAGEKKNVVGVDIAFVPPKNADLVISNNDDEGNLDQIVKKILRHLPAFEAQEIEQR